MAEEKRLYKIIYHDTENVHEIYANIINDSSIFGFVEISEIVFEKNSKIIDPAEERLKDEFANVKTTYIPQQAIIRIDYVTKKGIAKIIDTESKHDSNVTPLQKNILTFN
tara:strand:+ start:1293 stop:1622 length:330 start_codon:yes stop_codon:yes gene_type:complete